MELQQLLLITIVCLLTLCLFLLFKLMTRHSLKSEIDGKTFIELLIMADEQMNQSDRLIYICKSIRQLDISLIEPWQMEGYANIIKKELDKINHIINGKTANSN